MHRKFSFFFFLINASVCAQPKTDAFLVNLLEKNSNPIFKQVLQAPDVYRLQMIYTQINRDAQNKPSFTNYYFNYDPKLYFNPASLVKLPLALLSLEKLNSLKRKDIEKNTTMQFDSSQPWQKPFTIDTTAASGHPSLAHFIKRAFLISENDPYNRMYQFVGQGTINRQLHEKGYRDVRITRQFMGLNGEENRYTNQVRFLDKNGKVLYEQPPAYNKDSFDFSQSILLGNAHLNNKDSLVHTPYDFTRHNNISLLDMQQLLQSAMFPQSVPAKQRFGLTKDDYSFLYKWLSQFPSETDDPKYDTAKFYDSYVKFFFRDSTHRLPPGVRVFNKVGWSYGFLTDISYVADFTNHVEFMLSATLYVNSDGVLNDGRYEYNSIGHPFLFQLGQTIYHYELERKRPHKPDLSAFKIRYDTRDPKDTRPALQEVDN
jgi:hypothetical protein